MILVDMYDTDDKHLCSIFFATEARLNYFLSNIDCDEPINFEVINYELLESTLQ